ncbi:hypothetical protein BGZ96_001756 [Linnemannia gamsii]|uniref:Uncharacterized protein n=1 Tax=Linnemannia gamsii TaxID=64522 RepID=A0ABQ7K9P2_9FUNG|nr:hypothetical protein BGZ96_001756 [Linnemannia gamsii]
MGAGDLLPTDREYLDLLCPRIVPEESNKNENVAHASPDDDDDIKNDRQQQFLLAFLRFLYSGNYPREQGVGRSVNGLIQRLKGLGLFDRFTAVSFARQVGFTRDYDFSVHRTCAISIFPPDGGTQEDLKDQKVKDEDSLKGYDLEIHQEKTAVENFLEFNRMSGNTRRIAPMSSSKDGFVSFSEREIIGLFWKRPMIKAKILELVTPVFPGCLALDDVTTIWLRDQEPGFVIKSLLCDVALVGLTSRQRGKAGYRAAIKLMTIPEIKDHLSTIRQPDFDPGTYATKGYLLRGSIRTNGFSIQLTAFKLKELQAVRYRRFPEDRLPSRLTTTVGGLDYYLMEIRNITRTKEDVVELWPNCAPDQIKILSFIAIAVTIFAVASATTQAAPALHKRSGGGLVNVDNVRVPVNVEVKDVANHLADHAKILSRALVADTKVVMSMY